MVALGDERVWWCPSMDTSGRTDQLDDQSGNGHHGIMDGIVSGDWIDDTRYDGTKLLDVAGADLISATGAPCDESNVMTAFTVSFWTEFQDASIENAFRFGASNVSGVRCRVFTQNNGYIYFNGGSLSANWLISTAVMDSWVGFLLHFCLRYDGSLTGNDRLRLCINGMPILINGTPTIPTSITISDPSVELGRVQSVTDAAGKHDDFRVYDHAITDDEAITLSRFRGLASSGGGTDNTLAAIRRGIRMANDMGVRV